jgi:pimeloyl-ACP methyl ester carboxylesterase
LILDRRGYGESAPGDGEDFEVDAVDIRDALDTGAHLVAHSYGGLGALLAAAARPEAVYSLTLVEPVAFSAAIHVPIVRECVGRLAVHWATHTSNPRDFLEGFLPVMGLPSKLPDPLPPTMERGTKSLMRGRLAFTAEIPLGELSRAPFQTLVVSGGHSPVFESICDVLTERLRAERAVVPGAGHAVARTGLAFNERLDRFLAANERGGA